MKTEDPADSAVQLEHFLTPVWESVTGLLRSSVKDFNLELWNKEQEEILRWEEGGGEQKQTTIQKCIFWFRKDDQ